LFSDPDNPNGSSNQNDWASRVAYLVPYKRASFSESYYGSDAVGPRYRKVALNGRPMPDKKPELESETDVEKEETYVDAFDLSLRHDTSYVYVPLGASDLVLEVNASIRETSWSDRGGLRPVEELTSPFGVDWSSNLCAYVEVVETLGDETADPITVNVVDEGGHSQRFGTQDLQTFMPWPSSRVDKKTYLNTLTREPDGDLVLTKKFGNTLTYRACDAWFMYSTDRLEGSDAVRKHTYWRLEEIEDRYGNKIVYDYGTSNVSLIPEVISAPGYADQWISIARSANGRRVEAITTARMAAENESIQFNYTPATIDGYSYTKLTSVDYPDGTSKSYDYGAVRDTEVVNDRVTQHYHCNLTSITDKRGNTYNFQYRLDRTKEYFSGSGGHYIFAVNEDEIPGAALPSAQSQLAEMNSSGSGENSYKTQYGLRRQIASVTLPGDLTSTFAKTAGSHVRYGPDFSASSGTVVTDTLGNETTYTFSGVHGEIVDIDDTSGGSSVSVSTEWMIYYTTMTVDHGGLGTESFTYDLAAGLSLKSMTDMSGNETQWKFEDALPGGAVVPLAEASNFMTTWADPTEKIDALGRVETYSYGNYRVMSEVNDVHGTQTSYTVDSLGRRKSKTVTDASSTVLSQETYTYGDEDDDSSSDLPGFMVEKRLVSYSNISGQPWEQDLVVQYVPDSHGRISQEIVDPDGLALATTYTYDTNNNRISMTDPRGNTTTYTYDVLNRLVKVTYPPVEIDPIIMTYEVRYLYDARGNLACEIDENGRYTLYHHDALGRKIRMIRDMDGDGLPTLPDESTPQILTEDNRGTVTAEDLVTEYAYNDANTLVSVTDPRGIVTRHFYDGIQRVVHTYTNYETGDANADGSESGSTVANSSEKTHTQYAYQLTSNPGASAFSTEGFKPTQVIRHDATLGADGLLTLESNYTYDADYREVQKQVEYASGQYATTTTSYGTVTDGKEGLVTTVTDPLNKVTRTVTDGLGRSIEVRDAYGTTDETVTTTSYSSTGLAYLMVDPNGNHTETEYDAAGRAVKVWQPDPSTGLINRQPADDSTVGSPVTEMIYDDAGNLSATINPRGQRWDYTYDARNRRVLEEAPAVPDASQSGSPSSRPTTETLYDGAGNLVVMTDPLGAETVTVHDYANRPVAVMRNGVSVYGETGDQDLLSYITYDKAGNILVATDFEGNDTVNFYDALGRLSASVTNPDTGEPSLTWGSPNTGDIIVVYEYDDDGNRTAVIDGEGARTGFRYDGLARNTRTIWDEESELERVKTMAFNAIVMTNRTDEKGQITNYSYDDLHRLEDVENVGYAVDDRHYTYDANGNILSVTYPNEPGSLRTAAQTYDAINRVVTETSAGVTHTYIYDKAGNRLSTVYGQTGRALTNTYDALNRLLTLSETDGNTTHLTTHAYDLGGNIVRKDLPNDVTVEKTYDTWSRLSTETNTAYGASQPFAALDYQYDGVNNVREIVETYPTGNLDDRTVTNSYDAKSRLLTEEIVTGTNTVLTAYSYDDADNRASMSVIENGGTAAVTTYVYGDGTTASGGNSNQLVSFTKPDSSVVSFTYDANGNRVTRIEGGQTDTYAYDYENRLLALDYQTGSSDTGTYVYGYDHRTRRVERDESAISGRDLTVVVFSGGTSVQEHTTSVSSSPAVEYIRGSDYGGGIGGILYTLRNGTTSVKHYNSRGDVVAATDASGSLTYQAAYEAFGRHGDTASSQEWGSTEDRQQANTKDEDPTGLLNEGFRYRDLETGTFITRDPLGFVDGPNVYTYVVQNPWTKFDPKGLKFDDSTFDEKNDRMKNWGELDKKTQDDIKEQDWYNDLGDTEKERTDAYDKKVNNFNDELNKLRETPFGSAEYDYLKNHKDVFKLQFGYGYKSKNRSFVSEQTYTIAGFDDFGTIAHEFMHLVQSANPAYGNTSTESYRRRKAGPFSFLADPSDTNEEIYTEDGQTRPAFIEFQAMRAQNIVVNEYDVMHNSKDGMIKSGQRYEQRIVDGILSVEGVDIWVRPTLNNLRNRGRSDYQNGQSDIDRYPFENPSGSYTYPGTAVE
jgi:RHS repeat-associated protein